MPTITRREALNARGWARQMAKRVGFVQQDEESAQIEVADLGLDRLREMGVHILTLDANEWVSVKVMILSPWPLEPQHRHPPCEAERYPGKTEVLREQWGELDRYCEGPSAGYLPR